MTPEYIRDMIRNCQERPEGVGVLSTGQQIMVALALCDPELMPPPYRGDSLRAWARLEPSEVANLHAAIAMLSR